MLPDTAPKLHYVSITGLTLKSAWNSPRFWFHAVRSMVQARSAPGNISAETRTINGVHHTVSVWVDEAAMRAYLATGAHLAAMKSFRSMATGKTFGYLAAAAPDWAAVPELWQTRGLDR
jgi:quinol monooxygenase YgiN